MSWLNKILRRRTQGNPTQPLDTPESMQNLLLEMFSDSGPAQEFNNARLALVPIADANMLPKDHPFRLLCDEWGNGLGLQFISMPMIHVPNIKKGVVDQVLTKILEVNRKPSQRQLNQTISHPETRWEAMTSLLDALNRGTPPLNKADIARWTEERTKMATAWNEIATFIQRAETYMAQRAQGGFGGPG